MPWVYCPSRFIRKHDLRISKASCDLRISKVSQRLEGPPNLCVHSVMISILLLNFHVPIAKWYFSIGKDSQKSWHFELKVIVVLSPNLLRPGGEQTWPSKTKFMTLYSLRDTCPIKLNIATKMKS